MQRGNHQVPGLRGNKRRLNGFEVSHFPDDDHVGILPQDVSEGALKRTYVAEHLLLDNDASQIGMCEFNRVFNRYDLVAAIDR
jgi:hypothetical protein